MRRARRVKVPARAPVVESLQTREAGWARDDAAAELAGHDASCSRCSVRGKSAPRCQLGGLLAQQLADAREHYRIEAAADAAPYPGQLILDDFTE